MIGKLDDQQVDMLLKKEKVGRIACHADGLTYIIPVSYAYDGRFIYVHCYEGLKLELMRKNPEVCFEVDNIKDMANWQSVISWGRFEELTHLADRSAAMRILENRTIPLAASDINPLGAHWPIMEEEKAGTDGVVFRVHLKEKTGRFENSQIPS